MLFIATIGLTLLTPTAEAARCDDLLRQAQNPNITGPRLVSTFQHLASCDANLANEHYQQHFMGRAKDVDTLVALSMAAIEADVWNPVWEQLSKITSYDARDEIAESVGASCSDNPKVVTFLQGAYLGIRSTIDFRQWDDAYLACESDDLTSWLHTKVETPPNSIFDERFDALLTIYVDRQRANALPQLANAAIKAAENGPYDSILLQMDAAVQPSLGARMSDTDKQALEKALVQVAQSVTPSKAKAVADRLANAGSEAAAVQLLPTVYSDRSQSDGSFLYGALAIETGECKGTKQAVLHLAEIREPGKRWVVQPDIEGPIRGVKAKLSKCSNDGSDWTVMVTPEPVSNSKEIEAWAEDHLQQWNGKGFESKVQKEKSIRLP